MTQELGRIERPSAEPFQEKRKFLLVPCLYQPPDNAEAGHAILENAGGKMTDFDGNEVLYGKKDFKNPSLILKGKYVL